MDKPHRCYDCGRCECYESTCTATCGWDCGCPDYPPPETWDDVDG
jgi:hypothetical protein